VWWSPTVVVIILQSLLSNLLCFQQIVDCVYFIGTLMSHPFCICVLRLKVVWIYFQEVSATSSFPNAMTTHLNSLTLALLYLL